MKGCPQQGPNPKLGQAWGGEGLGLPQVQGLGEDGPLSGSPVMQQGHSETAVPSCSGTSPLPEGPARL